jgi:solute:Na+ symporter, SSS family
MNKIYDKLTGLDFAIVAIYLVALLIIGYIASFRNKKKDETLFMAGNSLNWYSIGFNMWGICKYWLYRWYSGWQF